MLRLKDGIKPSILENYGFELGQKFVDRKEVCIVNKGDYNDYWKFAMDDDYPDKVLYANDEYDQASVSIHVQADMNNRLWIECVPSSSYHIEGWDLNLVTDTLYDLISDGIIEKVED